MTDYDMFTAMLTRAGAPYKSEVDDDGLASITLEAWDGHGVVRGYPYFIAKFDFDADGAFVCVGIWE